MRIWVLGIERSCFLQLFGIHQLRVTRQCKRPIPKLGVCLKHLTVWLGAGRIVGELGTAGEESSIPIIGHFPGVNFVAQISVDQVRGPRNRTNGSILWVNTGDTGHHPVGVREIESWIEAEGHGGRCRLSRTYARDHAEHLSFWVVIKVVVRLRKRYALIEIAAFLPQLKFTRGIPFILANFKHRHDDNFYRQYGNALWLGRGLRAAQGQWQEQPPRHPLCYGKVDLCVLRLTAQFHSHLEAIKFWNHAVWELQSGFSST